MNQEECFPFLNRYEYPTLVLKNENLSEIKNGSICYKIWKVENQSIHLITDEESTRKWLFMNQEECFPFSNLYEIPHTGAGKWNFERNQE